MKTLVDSEVRLANAIESERFNFEKMPDFGKWLGSPFFSQGFGSIKKHIEDSLTPGRQSSLKHYKLNMYSKGGFFQPHVDSPAEDEMIGTLVVCLPSYHKGGELCVNHDGLQHVFDFSEHSGDASRIQWAAFYSNCIHKVKPVLEGHRVTITYHITLKAISSYLKQHSFENFLASKGHTNALEEHLYPTIESPSLCTEVFNTVQKELEKIQLVQSGLEDSPSKIGILLKHRYITKGLQQHLLKGEDKALFEFLVGKQWKCKLVSVLSRCILLTD